MGRAGSGGCWWAVLGVAVLALACAPAPASATPLTGISEQNAAMFSSPAFRSLGVSNVRIVAPWDAALTGDERTRVWIDTALARGHSVLVAFDKSRGVQCPGVGCVAPSVAAYEAGVAAFRARWPQITDIIPWNEPNHRSQPTYGDMATAGEYYNAVRRLCAGCRLVAGDFLDDGNLTGALVEYRRVLTERPTVWGLHNYWDATYFSDRGVETMLRGTAGAEVWLTETGGIVQFGTLAYDETRAADSIRWLYTITRNRPRVARMYLYHWQASPDNEFDGGLTGPDGSERPGLAVVREELARKPDAPAPLTSGGPDVGPGSSPSGQIRATRTVTRARVTGKALRLLRRGLRVGVSCVSAPSRCRGRLVIRPVRNPARAASLRLTMGFRLRPGTALTRDLPLTRSQRAALRAHRLLRVSLCLEPAKACRSESRPLQAG